MNKEDLRIVYMGTPDFAVEPLQKLVEGGYNIVVSLPCQINQSAGIRQIYLRPLLRNTQWRRVSKCYNLLNSRILTS